MAEKFEKKEFRLSSDVSLVPKVSAEVLSFLTPLDLGPYHLFDIRLCLEEALINAVKYGNKRNKGLKVRLAVEFNDRCVRLIVEDDGKGFDPKRLEDCTAERNLLKSRGRGVYLMHRLMDEVHYNSTGNRVLMVKYIKESARKKAGRLC